jgi:hypothetical protein
MPVDLQGQTMMIVKTMVEDRQEEDQEAQRGRRSSLVELALAGARPRHFS